MKTPLEKRKAGRITSDGSETRPTFWKIVIGGEKPADQFEAFVVADGSLTAIYRESQSAVSRAHIRGMGTPPTILPHYQAAVSAFLKSTGSHEPVRLQSFDVDKKGVAEAYYSIYRNGYPFVSHTRFGYRFTFDAKTNRFLAFEARENVPPVTSGAARLDKAAALSALQRIWTIEYQRPTLARYHWKRYWYQVSGEPQIGYYLPEGQKTAVLVWYIRFWINRDTGYAIQGGDNGMLIDAVSGKRVRTRTVP